MDRRFARIEPDRVKAKSILKVVDNTLEMISEIDASRFSSNVVREYYEVIRELASILMLLDGYRVIGEGAHKKLFEFIDENYGFEKSEIDLMNELRVLRNRISYNGFLVKGDFIESRKSLVLALIGKLRKEIGKKIGD